MNLFSIATSFPTALFSVLLGVALVYWLLALVGLVDFDEAGVDLDLDAQLEPAGSSPGQLASYMVAWGLNGVPFSLVVTLLALAAWVFSMLASLLILPQLPDDTLRLLVSILLLPMCCGLAIPVAALLIRPLRPLFRAHNAQHNAGLVGQPCRILTGVVDERQGRAEIARRGASFNIRVWAPSPNTLARGDSARIVAYDEAGNRYRVEALPRQ